jgi:hypothetical protein
MNNIGATYEPKPKQRDVSVTAQALTARFCDNYEYSGDQLDINLRPLHYCDKEAIEQYVEWFNNDCDFINSKYKSQRISSNGKGKVSSAITKVNSKVVEGLNINNNSNNNNEKEPIIIKRKTYEEIKEYYNNNLKQKYPGSRGPTKREPNDNGYYLSTIGKGIDRTRIRTTKEIYDVRKWNLNESHHYTFHPCYEDISNKDTLEFWLIYYN